MRAPRATPVTLTLVAVPLASLAVACGPAPYTLADDPPPSAHTLGPEGRPEPPDRWLPEVFPRPNPFIGRYTWAGTYDCAQGRTDVTLHVTDARGTWVRGIFEFRHAASGATGKYLVAGPWDENSGRILLAPGPWIEQPDGWVSVGLDGHVSRDSKVYAGKVTDPDCGAFRLRPVR